MFLKDCNQGVSPGATFSSECWAGEGSASKLAHMVGGRIQFLSGCYWTEGFSSLLAISWRPPSAPFCLGLCNTAVWFVKACKPRKQWRETASKMEVTIFYDPITKWHPISLALFYLLESKSLGPVCLHGEGMPQKGSTMRWRSLESVLEVCLPKPSISTSEKENP